MMNDSFNSFCGRDDMKSFLGYFFISKTAASFMVFFHKMGLIFDGSSNFGISYVDIIATPQKT
jgi:hypothetical protein